ncbi:hypothetical protein HanPI659440_Chr12g0473981 [Helianthus annuus]|nr:hypothetical protein HanPI659440_Chr12g0473981 [Helianthus annuus]
MVWVETFASKTARVETVRVKTVHVETVCVETVRVETVRNSSRPENRLVRKLVSNQNPLRSETRPV